MPFARQADWLLVPVELADDIAIVLVPAGAAGLHLTDLQMTHFEPHAAVALDAVSVPSADIILASGGEQLVTWTRERCTAALIRCNEASSSAFATLRQSYGGIEGSMNERFSMVEGHFIEAKRIVNFDARVKEIESAQRPGGGLVPRSRGSPTSLASRTSSSRCWATRTPRSRLVAVGGGTWPNIVRDGKLIGAGPSRCSA